ncbi:Sodium transporter HKT1 [Morus notabilis]|uniref:Sodium transporter HKT1 n=3 Tax=Morus notabilis TaxID=981085 RepID=W9RVP9_9ROSA|nr:Sodium transporter HKT1 [Morus notabilis]
MPKQLDVFFTSVSAATVSSMSTVEMEVFSNSQLVILTILMVLGGEVFTSFLEIQLARLKLSKHLPPTTAPDQIDHELTVVPHPDHLDTENGKKPGSDVNTQYLKYNSRRYLGHVVLGYFLVVHIVGSILIFMYVTIFSSARQVLKTKGIKTPTFSVFTTVSTFANCGFVPTNENMIVFKDNSGLLLLLIPQILLGNTLYPVFLRCTIRVLERITRKSEFSFLLRNHREMGYDHLLSGVHSAFLALTVLGFIFVQFVLFCAMEWNSDAMDGMNWYQRFVASLFEVVNSRHTGEFVVDISTISSAILVLFVIMM